MLTEAIFKRLTTARLNTYSAPIYRLVDAQKEFSDHVWSLEVLNECFDAAMERYEQEYPLQWNNAKQEGYRRKVWK